MDLNDLALAKYVVWFKLNNKTADKSITAVFIIYVYFWMR